MSSYHWSQIDTDQYPSVSGWTDAMRYANAMLCYNYMYNNWGLNEIQCAGVMGNIDVEGDFNPAQWQYGLGKVESSGYGMFQFTPSTKYRNTVTASVLSSARLNGRAQLKWILDNPSQWTSGYSLDGLKACTTVEQACRYWCDYWERPGTPNYDARIDAANYWYTEITGQPTPTPSGGVITGGIIETLRFRFAYLGRR